MGTVLQTIEAAKSSRRKQLAVLIDPDFGADRAKLERTVQNACMAKADLIFVGGSLLTSAAFDACVELVKEWSDRPVVLFPGSPSQLSRHADAVLFLSLISGRNRRLSDRSSCYRCSHYQGFGHRGYPDRIYVGGRR
ncbi:MAG: geranylgeranylglyceryl/heptaprenylglyceryl phosphate synthase [Flavobacteriales bacterium]